MKAYLPRSPRDIGRRGAILVALGIIWVCQGFGVVAEPNTYGTEVLPHIKYLPEGFRFTLWLVTGIVAIFCGIKPRKTGSDGFGWAALYIMPAIRAVSYLSGWILSDPFSDQWWWWIVLPVSIYCILWIAWFSWSWTHRLFKHPYSFGIAGALFTLLSMAGITYSYDEVEELSYQRGWTSACVWIGYIVIIWVISGWPEEDQTRSNIELEAASNIQKAILSKTSGEESE